MSTHNRADPSTSVELTVERRTSQLDAGAAYSTVSRRALGRSRCSQAAGQQSLCADDSMEQHVHAIQAMWWHVLCACRDAMAASHPCCPLHSIPALRLNWAAHPLLMSLSAAASSSGTGGVFLTTGMATDATAFTADTVAVAARVIAAACAASGCCG